MGLEERSLAQTGPTPERPHARADWKQMLGIGIVASILGIALGLLIDWFPVAASEEAKQIDTLWDVLIIASVPVFVGVSVVVMFSSRWNSSRRAGEGSAATIWLAVMTLLWMAPRTMASAMFPAPRTARSWVMRRIWRKKNPGCKPPG